MRTLAMISVVVEVAGLVVDVVQLVLMAIQIIRAKNNRR